MVNAVEEDCIHCATMDGVMGDIVMSEVQVLSFIEELEITPVDMVTLVMFLEDSVL